MSKSATSLATVVSGEGQADRVVPPVGYTAQLTSFTAGAMAFLVVFALALSMASSRLADRWANALGNSATLRISAPADEIEDQLTQAVRVVETTTGVKSARILDLAEQQELLSPWFGPDVPLEHLPIPRLIDLQLDTNETFDAAGLRLRLSAEVPGAVLDDHTRWRAPLVRAAGRLSWLGWIAILLMTAATAAMITLAARAALAANSQVIAVLRLVGATDAYIANAFVRRFTMRALLGAAIGTGAGVLLLMFMPSETTQAAILTGLRPSGFEWLWFISIAPVAAIVAYVATRQAALKTLGDLT